MIPGSRFSETRCQRLYADAIGCVLGVALMVVLGSKLGLAPMLVPFTTSIIVVTVAPRSTAARPGNVIFGHIIAALAGLIAASLFSNDVWPATLAVGIAVAAMQLTGTMHPPAGITAFTMAATHQDWHFVLLPVGAGAITVVAYAFLFHHLMRVFGFSVARGGMANQIGPES